MSTRLDGDVYVNGALRAQSMVIPDNTVTEDDLHSTFQVEHRLHYSQPNTAATDETRSIYKCRGATGTITEFAAGSIAKAVGDSTVTVDLLKNGTTVLSADITLDSTNTNRVAEDGTLSVTSLVAEDLLEIVIDATVGTGTLPTGVFASLSVKEDRE